MGSRGGDIEEMAAFVTDSPQTITYYSNPIVDK